MLQEILPARVHLYSFVCTEYVFFWSYNHTTLTKSKSIAKLNKTTPTRLGNRPLVGEEYKYVCTANIIQIKLSNITSR